MKNGLYEKNLSALKKRYPYLAERIIQCRDSDYRISRSGNNGTQNLIYRSGDQYAPEILFYHPINPKKSAKDFFEKHNAETGRFIVLMGMGLGYHLSELFRGKCLKRLLIIEKDPECLKWAMEASDLSELFNNPSVDMVVGCPEEELFVNIHRIIVSYAFGLKEVKIMVDSAPPLMLTRTTAMI